MSFSLTVNTTDFTEWQTASLMRSIEQPVASFSFSAPHPQQQLTVKAQDKVEISIDGVTQTKGKIFKVGSMSDAENASRTFSGRSSMADPVDSSVPLQPGLWQNVSAKNIINQLLQPYPVTADFLIEPQGTTDLRTNPGDTVWAAIDKLLKKENLLGFELLPGVLTISRAPESGSLTSLEFGTQDVLSLEGYSLDLSNRYSKYIVIGEGILGGTLQAKGEATDDNIDDNRTLVIQLSGNVDDARCQQVANYEASIRAARSLSFSYKVPSWNTNEGDLWIPNQRVNIIDTENDINGEHLITAVTLNETEEDEWAVLKFAPPESYTLKAPQPPASDDLFTN